MARGTGAERMRRYRERRSRGALVALVEVSADERDALVEQGFLEAWDCDSPDAVGAALTRLTARLARDA